MRTFIAAFGFIWFGFLFAGLIGPLPRPLFLIGQVAFNGMLCYRLFRIEAVADQGGLLVRNFLRTQRFFWPEVEGFRLGTPFIGIPVGEVIYVLLTNRKIVPLDVTMSRKRDDYLAALREWVN